MRPRAALIAEIADMLPEILRGLADRRPVTGGDWELTIAQVRALGVVGDHSDCTMGELARRLGIGLSAATALADRLVQHGLIEREADPRDRRVVCLRLAGSGKRVRDTFRREKQHQMRSALGRLSARELARIADGLALLCQALGIKER